MQVKKNRWRGVGFLIFWIVGSIVMIADESTLSLLGITEGRRLPFAIALFFIAFLFNLNGFLAAADAAAHPIKAIKSVFEGKKDN